MFRENIQKIRQSIIAVGFQLNQTQITIIGSGFAVSDDGKILTAAHFYNQLLQHQRDTLMGMAMVKDEEDGLEYFEWLPLNLIKKDDASDLALFRIEGFSKTLLRPLEFEDSNKVEVGQDVYFIGFPYAAQLINEGFGVTRIVNKAIVSNVKRDGKTRERNFIIMDTISNPGNSGCPLIDLETNRVIGVMVISFRTASQVYKDLDIREPMHICAAKPINLAKKLLS